MMLAESCYWWRSWLWNGFVSLALLAVGIAVVLVVMLGCAPVSPAKIATATAWPLRDMPGCSYYRVTSPEGWTYGFVRCESGTLVKLY